MNSNDMNQITMFDRSFMAVCPDCGKFITVKITGDVRVSELYSKLSHGRERFKLDDLDIDFQVNMKCKSCYENHNCEDNCIIESYAFIRLLDSFNRFGSAGLSIKSYCELSSTPKNIDGNYAMVFTMPAARYIISEDVKQKIEGILPTMLSYPDMTINTSVGRSGFITYEIYSDSTSYYAIEFHMDKNVANLVYDPKKHGKNYKKFIDELFIHKIDTLAALLELYAEPNMEAVE